METRLPSLLGIITEMKWDNKAKCLEKVKNAGKYSHCLSIRLANTFVWAHIIPRSTLGDTEMSSERDLVDSQRGGDMSQQAHPQGAAWLV